MRCIAASHVIRCPALAEQVNELAVDVLLAVRQGTCEAARALSESGFECIELAGSPDQEADELKMSLCHGCGLLIVDHYGGDIDFERRCVAVTHPNNERSASVER